MTTLTIDLSEELARRLVEIADRAGVRPEDLARLELEEWLSTPLDDFEKGARRVFDKNADLYRRLA